MYPSKTCSPVTQEENEDAVRTCRVGIRKAKAHLELNLNGNKKGLYRYISSKRKTKESMGPLLNEAVALVTKDIEKYE